MYSFLFGFRAFKCLQIFDSSLMAWMMLTSPYVGYFNISYRKSENRKSFVSFKTVLITKTIWYRDIAIAASLPGLSIDYYLVSRVESTIQGFPGVIHNEVCTGRWKLCHRRRRTGYSYVTPASHYVSIRFTCPLGQRNGKTSRPLHSATGYHMYFLSHWWAVRSITILCHLFHSATQPTATHPTIVTFCLQKQAYVISLR